MSRTLLGVMTAGVLAVIGVQLGVGPLSAAQLQRADIGTRTISGTVSLPEGHDSDELASITVRALGERGDTVETGVDSDGTYRLVGLLPAVYDVQFAVGNGSDGLSGPNLLSQWYDGATTRADGNPVDLTSNSATSVSVTLAEGLTISGSVSVPAGTASTWTDFVRVRAEGTDVAANRTAAVRADGSYTIDGLPAGTYTVGFSIFPRSAASPNLLDEYYADTLRPNQPKTVRVADFLPTASGIDVSLDPGSTMSVRVTAAPAGEAYVGLQSADGTAVSQAPVEGDGVATLSGIPNGTFYLNLTTYGDSARTSFQFLRDAGGSQTWTFDGRRAVSVAATAQRTSSRISGTVHAYGFSGYEGKDTTLGSVSVYQRLGSTWVLLPSLTIGQQPITKVGSHGYRLGSLAAGTYTVGFGPSRITDGYAGSQWTGNGAVSRTWYNGRASLDQADTLTIGAGQDATGVDGTIRPEAYTRTASGFVDVDDRQDGPIYSQFSEEIAWLNDQRISTGYPLPDGSAEYRPTSAISRDAMAAFLYRAAGEPAWNPPARSPFVDVTAENSAFYKEITWLASTGVTKGYQTSRGVEFRPFAPITRDAMAAFIYRTAGSPKVTTTDQPFRDISSRSTEFLREITWFADQGITTGYRVSGGVEYRPTASVTRDAMAAFLNRYYAS